MNVMMLDLFRQDQGAHERERRDVCHEHRIKSVELYWNSVILGTQYLIHDVVFDVLLPYLWDSGNCREGL